VKHFVIYKENDRYCSFPHIAALAGGQLAVVFRRASKFSADAAKKGLATHHDPDSSIEIIFSNDEGDTWPAETLRTVYKSDFGVNDPSITVLSDKSILARYVALDIVPSNKRTDNFRRIFSHRVEHGLVTSVIGNLISRSTDNGRTWGLWGNDNTARLSDTISRDPIIQLPDGSLMMSVYEGAPQRCDRSWLIRSFDLGKSWHEPVIIMADANSNLNQLHGPNYNETSLLHLGNGEMLAMVRVDTAFHTENEFVPVGGVGELHISRSFDAGLSWTPAKKTGIWGQPGSITRLFNGDILCTYGYRRKPYGVRCALSKDGGNTWNTAPEIILRDDGPTWDLGYPFSIQLLDGNIISVYYFTDNAGIRHVAGTKWS
jgi:sialidase-1